MDEEYIKWIMKEMIKAFNEYSKKMGELWVLFNKEVKKNNESSN